MASKLCGIWNLFLSSTLDHIVKCNCPLNIKMPFHIFLLLTLCLEIQVWTGWLVGEDCTLEGWMSCWIWAGNRPAKMKLRPHGALLRRRVNGADPPMIQCYETSQDSAKKQHFATSFVLYYCDSAKVWTWLKKRVSEWRLSSMCAKVQFSVMCHFVWFVRLWG